jgi:hypothetical protein
MTKLPALRLFAMSGASISKRTGLNKTEAYVQATLGHHSHAFLLITCQALPSYQ